MKDTRSFFCTVHLPTLTMQSAGSGQDDSFDFLFKIILIGDSNVGKTCVVHSFKSGTFTEKQQNTIGVDFTVRTLDIEGKRVKMQVWDTAGQERFRTITQSYYRSAHGAMITYDLTRRSTFESIPHWIREVEQYGAANVLLVLIVYIFIAMAVQNQLSVVYATAVQCPTCSAIAVGNKSDLESQRQVLFEDACTLAEERGVLAALETSAKEARNVEEAFLLLARELMARNGMMVQQQPLQDSRVLLRANSRPINSPEPLEKKSCQC
ncbi:ras-related protein Rab-19-like [Scleropages formosus]|uniref:Ras-related protein Rab-19-like n=1 Tax=Scleropages formosus TaxID=113540 RepID=A0A0N8K1S5_SCLFO|nr:ras-related protein Rab-19-like [Scleropages formosus]